MTDADSPRAAGPAPRPCESCPYRQDVPSAVWHPDEYAKLRAYDADTAYQPPQLFLCHQYNRDAPRAPVCAGWVGCHGEELLALRLAVVRGDLDDAAFSDAVTYQSPVALFESGAAAAAHGVRDAADPDEDAQALALKITRRRSDISE